MRVSVTFRHMDNSDALRRYAEDKIGRLKKYVYSPVDASVILSVEKHRQIAEVVINAEKTTIKGREATDNMYSAIDMVTEKIEKQIKKHKERLVNHKVDTTQIPAEAPVGESQRGREDRGRKHKDEEPAIVTKTVNERPMTVQEAVVRLDASGSEFVVFINEDTKEMNVIYRRKDNRYVHVVPNVIGG
jgi:putative sigma-54 modulation protein